MTATLPRPSGSPWQEDLLKDLEEHIESEQGLLDRYTELAEHSPEHVRYLIDLILDDEQRHHRVMHEMANRVLGEIEFRVLEPAVPYISSPKGDRAALLEATQTFLDMEKADLRDLKDLGKSIHRERAGGLFPLLVEIMKLDTRKHIAILEFIQQTARKPRR